MKIRIKKCDDPSRWYVDRIGELFDVTRFEQYHSPEQGIPENVWWCRTGDFYNTLNYVKVSDAVLVAPSKG